MNTLLPIAIVFILFEFHDAHAAEFSRFEYEEPHMGTKFRIVLYAQDKPAADKAGKAGFARVAELNRIMSDYIPTSELMELCKKSEEKPGGPVRVSADLFYVLAKAQEVSKLSDGAFDVTVRPLIVLWRHARRTQKLPDPKEMARARELVGYKKMKLDLAEHTVALELAGMQLDLGGIAKGYAADEVLKVLERSNIKTALCAAGGDIAVGDAPPGKDGWKIDIARLPHSKGTQSVLLKNAAISTSGDAEQFVVIDGVRYSHIVDPKTGLGLTGQRSVTVIARRGITADSMTKVASILPPDKALPLFDSVDGLATLIILETKKGQTVFMSKRFNDYLVVPTRAEKK